MDTDNIYPVVYHTPALLAESIDGLNITPSGVYVDVYQYSNSLDFSDNTRLRFRNYIINNLRDYTGKRLYDNHLKTELTFNTSTNETIKVFDIITNYTPINTR